MVGRGLCARLHPIDAGRYTSAAPGREGLALSHYKSSAAASSDRVGLLVCLSLERSEIENPLKM